ncbi:hypothetical protein IC744_06860 [Microbacterium hominis]|uniref:hypothetical protein n=1 Tax=Microbacterium hominis TaxID=162426 RepID=UPI00168BF6FA|nr:hypothetical protein [Microbacterium hominis]QOC26068.1 hypothetical protein IC745_01180 [Microbacterium hominis]QOC30039.1 hypothetical protein IC744_06860 [Microbacterium hominis]
MLPRKLFEQIKERDGHFCLLALSNCLGEGGVLDHRANRGMGGSKILNHPALLVLACSRCNGDKADGTAMVLMELESRGLYIRPDSTHEKTLQRAVQTPVEGLDGRWWMLISATERVEVPAPVGGYL